MNIQELAKAGSEEEIERHLLDLDSQFNFKCRKCGKCCKHQNTILFNSRDVFNISQKLQMTPKEVIEKYAETYIGSASKIPLVHMVLRGKSEVCPFLQDDLCTIQDCKPATCALFPLGRVVISKPALTEEPERNNIAHEMELEVKYILNDVDCGSRKRVNTVRDWLARFRIPEQDEFFLLWCRLAITLHRMISKLEEQHVSNKTLNMFWDMIFFKLYLDYDTSKEFLPQFRQASEELSSLCQEVIDAEEQLSKDEAT